MCIERDIMNKLSSCLSFIAVDEKFKILDLLKKISTNVDRYLIDRTLYDHLLKSMSSYKYPLSKQILKKAIAGEIRPVLLKDPVDPKVEGIMLPGQIPSFGKGDMSFVNISPKAAYVRNKVGGIDALNVKEMNLYAFLQMAYLNLNFRKFGDKINSNIVVCKNTAIAYSRMFSRCIDRLYAINATTESQEVSLFLTAVFALVTFFEYSVDNAVSFAFSSKISDKSNVEPNCKLLREGKLDFKNIEEFISLYNYEFDEYIKAGTLNLRSVVNLFQKMYGVNTYFGIEHAETFLTVILSPHIDYYNDKFVSDKTKSQADNIATALSGIFGT